MGYRARRCGDYLLVLQKPPLRAKATWRDHGIRDRWVEKVDTRLHPHLKPAALIRRLIAAVTEPGDLVLDPAAGSFLVMHVAHELGRRFSGCDLCQAAGDDLSRMGRRDRHRSSGAARTRGRDRGSARQSPASPESPVNR